MDGFGYGILGWLTTIRPWFTVALALSHLLDREQDYGSGVDHPKGALRGYGRFRDTVSSSQKLLYLFQPEEMLLPLVLVLLRRETQFDIRFLGYLQSDFDCHFFKDD